ncbi:NUDIX domain-containing protein [Ectopseudomonas mendocina]|uniref:NUDIX domain-containing protein n=1 Tax=Ectopseudomonas mendocina TaxID=300 RepID=A0ABZ2RGL8_ECTME
MERYPVSIKSVLFSPAQEVVLLLNERNEWELPGGRIERGETSEQCLIREISEELSLEVSVGKLLDTYLFEVIPGKHVFIATYHCVLAGPFDPKVSHEHKHIGLFPAHRLPDNLPQGYRASIERAGSPDQPGA